MEYYCLGPCPANEDAVQINANGTNALEAKKQAQQYAKLLRKLFPDHEKYGCRIATASQNHELGVYYEIVVRFEEDAAEITWDYAGFVEEFAPDTWKDEKPRDFEDYRTCGKRLVKEDDPRLKASADNIIQWIYPKFGRQTYLVAAREIIESLEKLNPELCRKALLVLEEKSQEYSVAIPLNPEDPQLGEYLRDIDHVRGDVKDQIARLSEGTADDCLSAALKIPTLIRRSRLYELELSPAGYGTAIFNLKTEYREKGQKSRNWQLAASCARTIHKAFKLLPILEEAECIPYITISPPGRSLRYAIASAKIAVSYRSPLIGKVFKAIEFDFQKQKMDRRKLA